MMHHSSHGNVHGGGGGGGGTAPHVGPPPGPGPLHRHQMHQPIPHQPMPPHQMHHDTRHPMGLTQPSNMGSVGQSMGGMGQPMGIPPPLHGPSRPPHSIRPMAHHAPAQHHNMPPMKTMRRPYHMGGSYGAQAPLQPPPPYQQPPLPPPTHQHHAPPPPPVEVSAEAVASASSEAATCDLAGAGGGDESEGDGGEGTGSASAGLPSSHPLANSKEKTPMCLVNELARFNKIKHQYRLTSETGPAHKKVFTVTLRLGETEEYTAEGSSIKRAQHAAASAALTQTRHTFPPPKLHTHHTPTHQPTRHTGAVMPTVELNALAMKLCEPAVYTSVPPVPAPPPPAGVRYPRFRPPYPPYAPRFHPPHPAGYPPPPYTQRGGLCGMSRGVAPVYRVRVSVGERAWPGEGPTPQAARHDAAARALHDLRDQLPPDAPPAPPPHSPLPASENGGDLLSLDVKSPVSLVHELALKRSLSVLFTVKSERGPPHMRVFVTTCTVGDLETEGEGNGKKMSKKRAAEKMIEEMKQRWPAALLRSSVSRLQQQQRLKRKQMLPKKKPRNLIKENGEVSNSEPVSESVDNPISRLAMARHAERARSPQYLVVEERGAPRKREFIVQCDAPPHHATGVGPNKKTAKRRAAHNVLLAMGLGAGTGEQLEPVLKNTIDNDKPIDTKLRTEREAGGGEVRQPVPGVLLMPDYSRRAASQPAPSTNGISETAATGGSGAGAGGGASGTAGGATSPDGSPGAKDQLLYLSQLLGFNVQFSDFPKRNHGEYLSLVALSTVPPVMCHGGGASTQQSHEQCSRAALRALAQMGLDTPSHDTTQGIPGASAKAGILSNGLND